MVGSTISERVGKATAVSKFLNWARNRAKQACGCALRPLSRKAKTGFKYIALPYVGENDFSFLWYKWFTACALSCTHPGKTKRWWTGSLEQTYPAAENFKERVVWNRATWQQRPCRWECMHVWVTLIRPTDGLLTASIQKWEMRWEKGSETEKEDSLFGQDTCGNEKHHGMKGEGAFTVSGGVTIS